MSTGVDGASLRLVILGVGHVFRIGPQIEHIILREAPDVVCLELDEPRFDGLMAGPASADNLSEDTPAAYRRLAKFQEEIADHYGDEGGVGSEMRSAAEAATRLGARVELIDKDAAELMDRLQKEMGFLERMKFGFETIKARFSKGSSARVAKQMQELQDDPAKFIEKLGGKFPTLKRLLIDERNDHMAARIREVAKEGVSVVVVVGDGHIDGVLERLGDLEPVVHRLREIQAMVVPQHARWRADPTGSRAGFSFVQDVADDVRLESDGG